MSDTADYSETEIKLQAAVFRRLLKHLRDNTDVQNIDMMITSGFCRNCLSGWYQDAAALEDIELSKSEARELIYGMAYDDWKSKYQSEATAEQQAALAERNKKGH